MRSVWFATVLVLVCAIFAVPAKQGPTWSDDVAPIIYTECSHCHTDGGHGPFPLESYRDVTRRAELVRQELLKRTMPPGIAESDFGQFTHAGGVSDEKLVMLQEWFRSGMPMGGPEPVRPAPTLPDPPDLMFTPTVEPDTPHEGNPVWCAVVIDPKLEKPLKVAGLYVQPHSPQIVRHVLVAIAAPGLTKTHWKTNGTLDDNASRLIGAWAPSYKGWNLPSGVSFTIQPGEKLIAQVLVVPSGRPMSALVDVGFYRSRSTGDREARWITLEKKGFELPPYNEVTITNRVAVAKDLDVLAVVPEARFFAYTMNIGFETAGVRKDLMRTAEWNPYWNGAFALPQPVRVPAGSELVSDFIFENEEHTLINEGRRPRTVHSGPALNEEVCRTHFLVVDAPAR